MSRCVSQGMRLATLLAVIGFIAMAASGAIAHPAPTSMASTCGQPPLLQRPATFSFSCDANVVFTHVRWQHWGEATATGTGTLYLIGNNCIPDCARAPRYRYPVRIVASQVAYCGSRRVYGLITAHLNTPDYRGQRTLSNRLVSCV